MVAYSFKLSFVEPILAGTMMQTIRMPRKRHARQGEELQLYSGMRTRSCRMIGKSICTRVADVRLDFTRDEVTIDDAVTWTGEALNAFARADGFGGDIEARLGLSAWEHMRRWWAQTHGEPVFRGVLVEWGVLTERGQE